MPDGDVATIENYGNISKDDFNHWYTIVSNSQQAQQGSKAKKLKPPPPLNSTQGKALKDQVMEFLITGAWIQGEADERGVSKNVTDTVVLRQFEQTKKQSFPKEADYKKFLKQSGQTKEDILFRVKLEALSTKIRDAVTKTGSDVSDSDAENYYNDNKQQFSQPERRDIQQVVTKDQAKAEQARQAIESGDSFASVVKKYSTDPASKSNGGKLAGVTKGTQDPALDAKVFTVKKGELSEPVKTAQGYVVFRVTAIQKGTTQSFAQSKSGIKQLLVSQRQQKKLDSFQTNFKNKWRARTLCATDYTVPDCANGREDTSSQTPPTPTPPGQKKPIPGSSGQAPPALDNPSGAGATTNLAGSGQGGPWLQPAPAAAPATAGLPGATPGAAQASTIPLALGGAPQKGAAAGAAGAAGGLPPGLGTQQGAPQQARTAAGRGSRPVARWPNSGTTG